jgi:ATP-binding cassette, subfamily B, bacterial
MHPVRLNGRWRASLYRKLTIIMWRSSPGLTALFAMGVVAASGLAVGFIVAIGSVVGSLPAAIDHGPGSAAAHHTEAVLVVVGVLLLAQQLVTTLQAATTPTLGRRVEGTVRGRVMSSALAPFEVLHLEDSETSGEIYAATTLGSARHGPMLAVESMQPMLQSLITGLGMAAVVGVFRWWLGLGLAVAWLIARDCRRRDNLAQSQMIGTDAFGTRRQAYFRQLALTPDAGKELRIFGLSDWLVDRFHQQWLHSAEALWSDRRERRPTLLWPIGVLLIVNAGAFALIGHAAQDGQIGLRGLTILLQATLGVAQMSEPGGTLLVDPMFVHGAGTLDVADRLEERLGTLGPRRPPTPPIAVREGIRFEGVSFSYPSRSRLVLDELELDIPAGRSLAIVGENGAGKTTLVKLLCGLMVPPSGQITVDGTPRAEFDQEAWRSSLAVVFQNFAQFQLSARENLTIGSQAVDHDDSRLTRVADRAGLADVLAGLPAGWDTPLTRQLRDGVDLSGGQWQRIALARALMAVEDGASVLVLDEPTANFDVRAEAAFYESFLDLTRGLTTVVISHRFATVRRADAICVLEGGRITELGSHDELVARGGTYARMFSLQAEGFQEPSDA